MTDVAVRSDVATLTAMADAEQGVEETGARRLRLVRSVDGASVETASDAALVEGIVAGNERAYETLVRRHQAELFSLLKMETGSTMRAEDGLQETLLTLARSAHTIREPDRVRFWLRRVARNTVRHRSATKRANRETDELRQSNGREAPPVSTAHGSRPQMSDPAALVEGDIELDRALQALPHDQRRAVWLCSIQGWTHNEVAEVYDVSINTVSSWVRRGHARLAAELEPAAPPSGDTRGRKRS